MKTITRIILAAAFVAGLVSCGGKEDPQEDGTKVTISVSPSSISAESGAMTREINVTVSGNASWTADASASWVSVSPSSGTGSGTAVVSVAENIGSARNASVIFSAGSSSRAALSVFQAKKEEVTTDLTAVPDKFDGAKRAGTTYQLLIYSFCDSDGDGTGDFDGITSRMDYFDSLGVTGLWLSPIHPAGSYHGYDVTDYYSVNPDYGTEEDFRELVVAAHRHGIKIYLDYVLNHTGKDHKWFREGASDPSSLYRDYYLFCEKPSSDFSSFPMLEGTSYSAGEWHQSENGAGAKGRFRFDLDTKANTVVVRKTDEEPYFGDSSAGWNLWYGDITEDTRPFPYFRSDGDGLYSMVLEFDSDWGFLIRSAKGWGDNDANKYGASSGNQVIGFDTPFKLTKGKGAMNITFSEPLYYMSCFGSGYMPDLNYGAVETCENSAAFKDIAASADKWIEAGVDGLRLDAVKHIYGGIDSYNNKSNVKFLRKWYDRCNATYRRNGHSDDMFMIGEVFNEIDREAPYADYLESLPAVFNFSFWWRLSEILNSGSASNFAGDIIRYNKIYRDKGRVPVPKLSNHDEDRAGEVLGKSAAREKQAAAILLTSEGKPFIYQGEELGYYGGKSGGDEYVRTPMNWDGGKWADGKLGGKEVAALKGSGYSVKTQEGDEGSVLNVYESFSRLRNTYDALANGTMSAYGKASDAAIAAWYMTASSGEKMLVMHNVSSSSKTFTVSDDMSRPVGLLGTGKVRGTSLTLGANSSVVFKLY